MLNNYVDTLGNVVFSNYSHEPSQIWTDTQAYTLTESGENYSNSNAEAFFYESELSGFFTESFGFGTDGSFAGNANNSAQIIASFAIASGETFSFDFLKDLLIESKEIENPDAEHNQGELNVGFVLLDTTDPNNIEVLDYADIYAYLLSSQQAGDITQYFSENFTLDGSDTIIDIDGDNGIDLISAISAGTYERTFDRDTNLTLIQINHSSVEWIGDSLIDNLDSDFVYGTIWSENWFGTSQGDRYYASMGDDVVFGRNGDDTLMGGDGNDRIYAGSDKDLVSGGAGDDILNGGNGDDFLEGDGGNDVLNGSNGDDVLLGGVGKDTLNGSNGDDILRGGAGRDLLDGSNDNDLLFGGRGNDTLTGGFGEDLFFYQTSQSFDSNQIGIDIITDLETDKDRIVLAEQTFTILTADADGFLSTDEFEVVSDDDFAEVSEAFIVYSSSTGNLFYNQNASEMGLGEGGQFATIQNIPTLDATIFEIVG